MKLSLLGQDLELRAMSARDEGFVYACWLRSYLRRFRGLTRRVYFEQERARVDRIVHGTKVLCTPGAEHAIHGFVCGGAGILHYVYVPFELRNQGLARQMVGAVCGGEVSLTHFWPWARLPDGWSLREDIPWKHKLHIEASSETRGTA